MNECKIKCLVADTIDRYIYDIYIYDRDDKIVYQEQGDGCFSFRILPGLYKVYIRTNGCVYPALICKYIYILRDSCNSFYFFFYRNLFKKRKIIFCLMDKNYQDLPIEKGEIELWQHNM